MYGSFILVAPTAAAGPSSSCSATAFRTATNHSDSFTKDEALVMSYKNINTYNSQKTAKDTVFAELEALGVYFFKAKFRRGLYFGWSCKTGGGEGVR